jgi:hypothetical protein
MIICEIIVHLLVIVQNKKNKEALRQLHVAIFDVRCANQTCDVHFVRSKPVRGEKKLVLSKCERELTRQAMYVWRNVEAHSRNHGCCGQAVRITYPECICSLSYPACSAHAPYCCLWPVRLYHIFPHLINGTVFGGLEMLLNIKCVFWFRVQLASETFLILRRMKQDVIINVHRSSCKLPVTHVTF